MLDKLIESELTDSNWESWSEYRNALTDYIIDSIKHRELKRKLKKTGRLRDKSYNIEELVDAYVTANGVKPSIAIWGAGGCNDIDIVRLAKYFRLILIDRDLAQLEKVRERYKLSSTDCACVDIKFFDVTYNEYEMFEAMLMDKCDSAELVEYMEEIVAKAVSDESIKYKVNYSVAVGLASQLVSRFVALAYSYDRLDELKPKLREISNTAVERMNQAIADVTEDLIMYGYEKQSILSEKLNVEDIKLHMMEQIEEIGCEQGLNQVIYNELIGSEVEGNMRLVELIRELIEINAGYNILDINIEIWPFTERKKYIMNFVTLDFDR